MRKSPRLAAARFGQSCRRIAGRLFRAGVAVLLLLTVAGPALAADEAPAQEGPIKTESVVDASAADDASAKLAVEAGTVEPVIALAAVFILGVAAQWLAWKTKLPSILLLLLFGFLAGPVFGLIPTDRLLAKEQTFSFVTLAVGLVLFEGALQLRFREIRDVGRVLASLLTVGVLVTWVLITLLARYVLGFTLEIALLLGALLTVTGPTVIGPILRQVRPTGRIGPIVRWEGIVIDPIGAVLAVLVFDVLASLQGGRLGEAGAEVFSGSLKVIFAGGLVGTAVAFGLLAMLRKHNIPDHLQSPCTLASVLLACVASNLLAHESGLVAVTVMGIVLANQRKVDIRHIFEFKENLSVLLISTLFILLTARLKLESFAALSWRGPVFVLLLILVVRPIAVWASTFRSQLSWREKAFLAAMAPRGIVAAAVASVFALETGADGRPLIPADQPFAPATFLVIVGSVAVYGLAARPLARKLDLAFENPQGALIASAHMVARAIARSLREAGYPVLLVDINYEYIQAARLEGLPAFHGNILSEQTQEELPLDGIGRLLALTRNDEVNALATLQYAEFFGRKECYQLVPQRTAAQAEHQPQSLQGRYLFDHTLSYNELVKRYEAGYRPKATKISETFTFQRFVDRYVGDYLLLFIITPTGDVDVVTTDEEPRPEPGSIVIAMVQPKAPKKLVEKVGDAKAEIATIELNELTDEEKEETAKEKAVESAKDAVAGERPAKKPSEGETSSVADRDAVGTGQSTGTRESSDSVASSGTDVPNSATLSGDGEA